MKNVVLDFEKPLHEIKSQIDMLERKSQEQNIDLTDEIVGLTRKYEKMCATTYANMTPWDRVQLARHPQRPYTLDYIERIFTDFIEFHGDRRYSDDAAIVGGFAKLDGLPVMVIGTQKGRGTKDNLMRNFGCPHPEGYRKALRLMKMAELARIPVVTFVDTPGAFPGVASEERHIGEAIAVNLREMFGLTVPVIATVIGEGGSGGALGVACGNRVLIMENAYYSVITPEGCAAILWKDRKFAPKAAEMLRLTGKYLKDLDIVDDIIPEPVGGAQNDYDTAAQNIKKALLKHLKELRTWDEQTLVEQRYNRFRKIGRFAE